MLDIQPEDLPLYMASSRLTAEHLNYHDNSLRGDTYDWHEVHMVPFLMTLIELYQEGLWPPMT